MVIRPPAERPMEFAVARGNGKVIDARDATLHEPAIVELPVLVAVGAMPIARIVVPLIRETNSNAIPLAGPKFFDEPIVQLPGPFARKKLLDRFPASEELRAVAPDAVGRIGQRYSAWITRIPGVLRHPHLLSGGLGGERRQWRAGLFGSRHGGLLRHFDPGFASGVVSALWLESTTKTANRLAGSVS